MSRASDLANLIASGNTTIHGEAGAPTVNAGQSNQTGGTTNLQQGLTKVWINFNDGSEADAVQDSFNAGSFTDNGAGELITNFTNSMANTGYSTTNSDNNYSLIMVNAQTTSSTRSDTHTTSFNGWDSAIQKVTVHGDLA